ncbi:MAG TPA: ester cyclase [Nitrososphaera sp.]|jgi:predicted ester cyclase
MSGNSDQNITTVRRLIEAFNTGDVTKLDELVDSEYFNHESQASPERGKLRGPDEVRDTITKLRSAFADLHYEEQETIASGDKVFSILRVTGKHVGNFFGIEPTGKSISYMAAHIYRLTADSKVVEHRAIRDDLRLMMQLDVIEPAKKYEQIFQAWKGMMARESAA